MLGLVDKSQNLIEHVKDRPGQVSRHISSTEKAHRLLGWTAKIDLDDGLQQQLNFIKITNSGGKNFCG